MKIICIFAPGLWVFKIDNDFDEFELFYNFCTDAEQLYTYFSENKDLPCFENISVREAVTETMKTARELYRIFETHSSNADALFEPLNTIKINESSLFRQKSKRKWLRIYALKIDTNVYVITGGAIKQSQEMKDHPMTERELRKIERCRDYLIEEGIYDKEGFKEIISIDI